MPSCLCSDVLNELIDFRPMVSELLQTAGQQQASSFLHTPTVEALVTQSNVSLVTV